jgi:alpha-beta hydrolase superfamily lysophospholipase
MKHVRICIVFLFLFLSANLFAQWEPDILGEGFEQLVIKMPDDYEGAVNCVLVRKLPTGKAPKAVLYIHGFNDYFFQKEQAEKYNEQGYAFYAVDLRKYGRSYMPHQKMGNLRSLSEYYADIDSCLSIIKQSDYGKILLAAHSTGGLIACVYAHDCREKLPVDGLILNSPFFDMNFPKFMKNVGVPVVSGLGAIFPNIKINTNDSLYTKSLHKDFMGEWDYDLNRKPAVSIPVNFGWARAIHKGHKRIKKGLNIPCPVLVMHSDNSVYGSGFSEKFMTGDAVLNVKHIHERAGNLGENISVATINDGLHDLVLSKKDVREKVYDVIFAWIANNDL